MRNQNVESLLAWLGWNRLVESPVFQASRERCVYLAVHLWDLVIPRLEIIVVAASFVVRGLISPRRAWMKMHDSSLYAMLDSRD